jgi:ketosteroid isomerase-like protein
MNRLFLFSSALLLTSSIALAQSSNFDAAPAAAPAPASTITTTQPSEVVQFQKFEDSWSDSINRRDQYGLELVLSPLFVDVSATGDVTTRNQQVAQLLQSDDKTLSLTQKVITVRMLGDVAVANGTYSLHHKVNAQMVDEKGVFTHVYQKVRGGWLCVNSQRTVLRTDSNVKQKKQQSSADQPFHIPFFSKSDKSD